MRSRELSVMRWRAAPSTSSRLACPTTSRIALSLTSASVFSRSLTWNSTFTGSAFWYWMAARISTRFTSAVSTRERYSTLFTCRDIDLGDLADGPREGPAPSPRSPTRLKRPKRWITPRSEASIW